MSQPKRALISVSDKTGLLEIARELREHNIEIIASGGTYDALCHAGIAVTSVESVTGAPEMFSGRVKTLHPALHGAILFDRENQAQRTEAKNLGIEPIDIVIVNLYQPSGFDIGGPALIRAAAKNWSAVSVITAPAQYRELASALARGITDSDRKNWALRALEVTARYDLALLADLGQPLRYGENPHQRATKVGASGVAGARVIQGRELSFNNYLDLDAAFRLADSQMSHTFVIVKHAIPVGIASAADSAVAFERALASDPLSAFGGVIATNAPLTGEVARQITQGFFEAVIAPEYSNDALDAFGAKANLRVLQIESRGESKAGGELREISGGFLFQEVDDVSVDAAQWRLVSGNPASIEQLRELEFALRAVARTRSNAILLTKNFSSIGIGAAQVNRLDAARIAVSRAGSRAKGAVAASDGFFPFADGVEVLIDSGIAALVAPAGSIRDQEVIDAARKSGLTFYHAPRRHFSHN